MSISRAQLVARWFGINPNPAPPRPQFDGLLRLPAPNEILLITGPSGSGKSTLLRHLRRLNSAPSPLQIPSPTWLNLATLALPNEPTVELFPTLEQALRLLALVGLADAYTYILPPRKLSTGQRFRLQLARALAKMQNEPTTLVCDEYAALLDPLTAAAVSHALRQTISRTPGARAILATPRTDLARSLNPDHTITCNFGQLALGLDFQEPA